MKRKIRRAEVTMVSLCKRGLNTLQTLYKGDGARISAMVKAAPNFEERGELLAVVAVPGLEFADGDFYADESAVRESAYAYMLNGAQLDLHHDKKALPKSEAFVAESFMIQKGDPRFADWKDYDGKPVDVTNGWGMLLKLNDPALRESYSTGEWDGVSLYAPAAQLEIIEKADSDLIDQMRKLFTQINTTPDEDDSMKPEDLKEIAEAVTAAVVKALPGPRDPTPPLPTPAPKPKPQPDDDGDELTMSAPVWSGDISNEADVRKHKNAVRAYQLSKSGALNDPAKLDELLAEIEASKVDPKSARAALHKSNPDLAKALDEKDALESRIKALTKSSNQPGPSNTTGGVDQPENPLVPLTKGDDPEALIASALSAARHINERSGRVPVAAKA